MGTGIPARKLAILDLLSTIHVYVKHKRPYRITTIICKTVEHHYIIIEDIWNKNDAI